MFTGIVQALGKLVATAPTAAGKRLTVALADLAGAAIALGDSVCISGVCLTVVSKGDGNAEFDVITETLNRTTLGSKKPGDLLNLELSLQPHSFLGGHFVQGHVDAIASVVAIQQDAGNWRITFQASEECAPLLVPKGSVTVDGVSMTIAEANGPRFTLAVIPTTLEKTTLGGLRAGDRVNVETDILARTVVHYLSGQWSVASRQNKPADHRPPTTDHSSVTMAKLQELGFA